MANPEHLEILLQGVDVWNQWRNEHPEIRPDFIESDLRQANLSQANLRWANFYQSNLSEADLSGANLAEAYLGSISHLSGANFTAADLRQAHLSQSFLDDSNFSYANLSHVDLSGSILENADFSFASLHRTDFYDADLSGADFKGAKLSRTILVNVDLSKVLGLDSCSHRGPSIVDHETLALSGTLPLQFLRGCGFSDIYIAHIPALLGGYSIQFYSCFISYSSKDQEFANKIYTDLQDKGVRCWFAPEDLKIGDKIRDRIDESIRLRDKLLLILSEHSIASEWVEHEVESALEEEKQRGHTILFPIREDDAVMESNKAWAALIRRTRHIGDFTRWKDHDSYQRGFDRLLRDLIADE
jgi:uncharacterized protein YjbI with pentapeptide repeats